MAGGGRSGDGKKTGVRVMQRAKRIEEATTLRLEGKTLIQISAIMSISVSVVWGLLKDAREEWAKRANASIGEWLAEEIAMLTHLYQDIYGQWNRSKQRSRRKTVEIKGGGKNSNGNEQKKTIVIEAQCGNPALADKLIRIRDRIESLKGLDAPKRTELTGAAGGPLQLQAVPLSVSQLLENLEVRNALLNASEAAARIEYAALPAPVELGERALPGIPIPEACPSVSAGVD